MLTTPGHRGVHYGNAFVKDAAGREREVNIVDEQGLALELDTTGLTLPLTIDPLIWDIQQKILASQFTLPSFAPNDYFGKALAVSGNTVLIGAPGDRDKGLDAGATYVFTRTANSAPGIASRWVPQQKLTASDGSAANGFGSAVAVYGDVALVGAPNDDEQGAAYVFTRSNGVWTQQQKLVPSDLSASSQFGFAVALTGDNLVVGAPLQASGALTEVGVAYAFGKSGTLWAQQQKFVPPAGAAVAALHFGAAVALASASAVVGRDNLKNGGVDWFTKTGSTWNVASSGVTSSVPHFGSALAMTDTNTVIGVYGDPIKGPETGSVSVLRTSAPHTPIANLIASDGNAGDRFGFSVGIAGNTVVVGAPNVDGAPGNNDCPNVPDTGAVYAFGANGATYTQQQRVSAYGLLIENLPTPTCDPGEGFGYAVASGGSLILMGAPFRSDKGWLLGFPNEGAVFEDEFALTNASPCTDGTQCFSGYCLEGVCCASACDGACRSCKQDLKDQSHSFGGDWVTGVCGEVAADTDPKDGCDDAGTFCGPTGNCSGAGSCQAAHPTGTPCGSSQPFCATTTSAAESGVCGNFSCGGIAFDCERGYSCKAGVCNTSCQANGDCDAAKGFLCRLGLCKLGAGVGCTEDKDCVTGICEQGACSTPSGVQCVSNNQCLSKHCADGVCCDASCKGPCEACALPGHVGTCTPVFDDPADAPGLCAPGNAGEGGEGGEGGAGFGAAPDQPGGAAGEAGARPDGGQAGTQETLGGAGKDDESVECSPACTVGLVCNHHNGACDDQRVTACGCRAAGQRSAPNAALSLLTLAGLACMRRRRNRRSHAAE